MNCNNDRFFIIMRSGEIFWHLLIPIFEIFLRKEYKKLIARDQISLILFNRIISDSFKYKRLYRLIKAFCNNCISFSKALEPDRIDIFSDKTNL
jgi:hypothetical protein